MIHPIAGRAAKPSFPVIGGQRVMHGAMMLRDAKMWVEQQLPYWNRTGGLGAVGGGEGGVVGRRAGGLLRLPRPAAARCLAGCWCLQALRRGRPRCLSAALPSCRCTPPSAGCGQQRLLLQVPVALQRPGRLPPALPGRSAMHLPPLPPHLPAGGKDHIFLISHDEGACWAPTEIMSSTILTHWGRMDMNNTSETGYGAGASRCCCCRRCCCCLLLPPAPGGRRLAATRHRLR
jgi:hypothetical protein